MKSVRFYIDNALVEARPNETILEAALRAKVPLEHSCGGFGTCGTCRIFVEKGLETLPDRNEIEAEMAVDRSFRPEERLSCQNHPTEGLRCRRAPKA